MRASISSSRKEPQASYTEEGIKRRRGVALKRMLATQLEAIKNCIRRRVDDSVGHAIYRSSQPSRVLRRRLCLVPAGNAATDTAANDS